MAIVLYLAEIQKQNKGFMGGVETKLKLLACQRNDQSWSIISGNETITSEEGSDFGEGALITINLGVNRQIKGKLEPASQRIIGILQGFSRLLEKTKTQEQEIAQWKESLTIQSEELSRREIEMETRLEQLEHMEEEFKEFEQQRQEIERAKIEAENIKAEFETKSTELQGAWEQLRGQQQSLQEQIQQSKAIDETQAATIKRHLQALSLVATSNNSLEEKFNLAFSALNAQQELLDVRGQKLEKHSQEVQEREGELNDCQTKLEQDKQELERLLDSISDAEKQLQTAQNSLVIKQELLELLTTQEQAQTNILQMFAGFDSDDGQKIDVKALENMPLPNLEQIITDLQKDLEKVAQFVNDQEEELGWQCKAVEELEAKIASASEFDRLTLEQELADEKEAKKMLDQTLVGQRRSLKERHGVLVQHSRILKRRKGIVDLDDFQALEIKPIEQSLKGQQQELLVQKEKVNEEIARINQEISKHQEYIRQNTVNKQELCSSIEHQQQNCHELRITMTKMESLISFYQEHLQPLQNGFQEMSQKLVDMKQEIATCEDNNPEQAIAEIDRIIAELTVTSV